jgi:hypothetical protein
MTPHARFARCADELDAIFARLAIEPDPHHAGWATLRHAVRRALADLAVHQAGTLTLSTAATPIWHT